MSWASPIVKFFSKLVGKFSSKAGTKGASKIGAKAGSKISFRIGESLGNLARKIGVKGAVGIGGIGLVAYSFGDGFRFVRDVIHDGFQTITGLDLTDNQVNFLIIGIVTLVILALVSWWRRR